MLTLFARSRMSRKTVHSQQCDPGSASTRKRPRLDCGASSSSGPSLLPFAGGDNVAQSCPPSGLMSPSSQLTFSIHSDLAQPTPASPLDELGMAHSLAMLEAESHAVGLRQSQAMQSDSQTGATYARHLTRYQAWWASYQAECCVRNPRHTPIPSLPVTGTKVVMFLQHETTREKVCPPSSLGST
jgi:hypothetical protein